MNSLLPIVSLTNSFSDFCVFKKWFYQIFLILMLANVFLAWDSPKETLKILKIIIWILNTKFIGLARTSNFAFDELTVAHSEFDKLFLWFLCFKKWFYQILLILMLANVFLAWDSPKETIKILKMIIWIVNTKFVRLMKTSIFLFGELTVAHSEFVKLFLWFLCVKVILPNCAHF